jgi:hypothetical protein
VNGFTAKQGGNIGMSAGDLKSLIAPFFGAIFNVWRDFGAILARFWRDPWSYLDENCIERHCSLSS